MPTNKSDEIPILANMPPKEAAARLRAVGEDDAADALERMQTTSGQQGASQVFGVREFFTRSEAYMHTGSDLGFIPFNPTGVDQMPVYSARQIDADTTFKKARIKITFDCFYVAKYPGHGTHNILLHFSAQNQVRGRAKSAEDVHFITACDVKDGETAAVQGYPIFIGLNVGNEGLTFTCKTVNVTNKPDNELLKILGSPILRDGLKLASTFQPALIPLSAIATGLLDMVCNRDNNTNVAVYEFRVGLDFKASSTSARLAEGSYIAAQLPADLQRTWDWSEWMFNTSSGLVVSKTDPQQRIPYNYLIFRISRFEEG